VRLHLLRSFAACTEAFEAGTPHATSIRRRDANAETVRMRESALGPVEQLYCLPGGRAAVQRQLVRYGALLVACALWTAARALRDQGLRPARSP
jgi:hypothetical protein